jgi:hypothetical protein
LKSNKGLNVEVGDGHEETDGDDPIANTVWIALNIQRASRARLLLREEGEDAIIEAYPDVYNVVIEFDDLDDETYEEAIVIYYRRVEEENRLNENGLNP